MCERMVRFYEATAREAEALLGQAQAARDKWQKRLSNLEEGIPTPSVGKRARKGELKVTILYVLGSASRGLSNSEIHESVRKLLPTHHRDALRVALYRLRDEGRVRNVGGSWLLGS